MTIRTTVAALLAAAACSSVLAQSDAVHRGEKVFASAHCIGCHAATPGNIGTMVLAKRLGKDKAVLADRGDLDPAFTSAIVRNGMGIMPGFRPTELSDAELADLAAYLGRKR
nr:cytochrome c [Pseudomonas sp. HS-2]